MKVICIKDFKYGNDICFRKDSEYETESKGKRVYTVSSPGKPIEFFQIASDLKDTCYRFPLKEFNKHFITLANYEQYKSKLFKNTEVIAKPKNNIEMSIKPRSRETDFNVKETFLSLTKHTCPYGHEHRLRYHLPEGVGRDKHGNYFYTIGNSKTVFACHLDTVSTKGYVPVNHIIEGNMIKTDGTTTLGADDKAGVTILLYLIHKNVPGTYYFFIGEEVGCIGSKAASKEDNFSDYDRIVSFDRRNTCSIITFQGGMRCCSDEFANALSSEYTKLGLELKPDNTGVYTDSAEFTEIISECTNISVGYYSEHTFAERQDIVFLQKLCEATAAINWEALPKVRDPKVKERKKYNNHNYSTYDGPSYRNRAQQWNNYNDNRRGSKKNRKNNFHDYDYGYYAWDGNNSDENLIDAAYEEDKKKKNKKNKKNKYKNFDVDLETQLEPILRDVDVNVDKDVYLTYREFLNEQNFHISEGISPIFSIEEYAIIENTLIKDWQL